jgi:hypothetical protein
MIAIVAVAMGAAVVPRPGHGRSPHAHAAPRVLAPPHARPPTRAPLDRRAAIGVARRFAAAYTRWDAGRRTSGAAHRLASTTTPQLFAGLSRERARPTAGPPRPLGLGILVAARRGDGAYDVALGPRRPRGAQVATVVVAATAAGPRVTQIQR